MSNTYDSTQPVADGAEPIERIIACIEAFIAQHGEGGLRDEAKRTALTHALRTYLATSPDNGEDHFAQHDYEHHI